MLRRFAVVAALLVAGLALITPAVNASVGFTPYNFSWLYSMFTYRYTPAPAPTYTPPVYTPPVVNPVSGPVGYPYQQPTRTYSYYGLCGALTAHPYCSH